MCQYVLPKSENSPACMQLSNLCSNVTLVRHFDSCRFSICKLRWNFWKLTQQAGTTLTAGLGLPGSLSLTELQAMWTAYRQTTLACSCRQVHRFCDSTTVCYICMQPVCKTSLTNMLCAQMMKWPAGTVMMWCLNCTHHMTCCHSPAMCCLDAHTSWYGCHR